MSRSASQLAAVLGLVDLDCPLVRLQLVKALSLPPRHRGSDLVARRARFVAEFQERTREACEGLAALAERAPETCVH